MINKSVVLPCDAARAFVLFTDKIDGWWPESHRPLNDASSRVQLLESGRFCDLAADGQAVELGRVRVWEPPSRLVLDFYLGTGPARPTEVVVTFKPEGAGTRVVVEHRSTASSEEAWQKVMAIFDGSWTKVLAALGQAAQATPTV